jgi:CBS domain-containing protein
MNPTTRSKDTSRLALWAENAEDLMTTNPISISETATLEEAIAFLTESGYSAAPVVDSAGRAVGVLSRTDILTHERSIVGRGQSRPDFYARHELAARAGEIPPHVSPPDSHRRTLVRDVMTPTVISVAPTDSVVRVIGEMVALKVHRLFVVDENGLLVGVISALDVLRNLRTAV